LFSSPSPSLLREGRDEFQTTGNIFVDTFRLNVVEYYLPPFGAKVDNVSKEFFRF